MALIGPQERRYRKILFYPGKELMKVGNPNESKQVYINHKCNCL